MFIFAVRLRVAQIEAAAPQPNWTYNRAATMPTDPRLPGQTSSVADTDAAARHLRTGWWSIAGFGLLGLVLETLHGFKVGAYLDVSSETRRLMWTLAHAHGTLLGLVHVGLGVTIRTAGLAGADLRRASASLTAAGFVLPLGFFAGGVRFYAGDPGLGIALVPVGAVLLIYAAASIARLLPPRV